MTARVYDNDHMLADLAFVNSRRPWGRHRRAHMVKWWCCFLRWLRWVEEKRPVEYFFFIYHNSDTPKYKRAIDYAASKRKATA